ncbi:glycosyltransferase family 2 protein [Mycobacterium sp. C31M]
MSVIVPAYQARETLREAVDSLLHQTFHNLEVIVIDDASPDDSAGAVLDIDDSRLGIFLLRRNAGLAGARNAGLALSRGPFVALLDADDVSRPTRIARQLRAFQGRPDLGLVGCLVNRIDVHGRRVERGIDAWRLDDESLKPFMLFNNPFPAVTQMLRRAAIPAGGFRPIYAEDYAMAADVARHHSVAMVRAALVDYRESPGGIMGTKLDQVCRDTLVTQRLLLRDVGVATEACDPALMAALIHFGTQRRGALSFDRLLALRRWMRDVERANERSGRYAPDALARAAARAWDRVLLHATKLEGMRFGRRYATDLLSYRASQGRPPVRARAAVHASLNVCRRTAATAHTELPGPRSAGTRAHVLDDTTGIVGK